MNYLIDFFVSLGANAAAYCVSKWLERHRKGQ